MHNRFLFTAFSLPLLFVLFAHGAFAFDDMETPATTMIRTPGVTEQDLQAFAKAQGKKTLVETLDLTRPGQEPELRLRRLLQKAQEAWLNGPTESAQNLFRQVATLALQADWRPAQREAIHYSILRLAQLSTIATEKESWLEQAATLFSDLEMDRSLFPPPLVESYSFARSRALAKAADFAPARSFPEHAVILINGRRFEIKEDTVIRLPPGIHRITGLSNSHPPVTVKMTAAQMSIFRAELEPLVTGDCDKPRKTSHSVSSDLSVSNDFNVYFGESCMREYSRGNWISRDQDLKDLKRFSATLAQPTESSSGELKLPWKNEPAPQPTLHKPWFWIGATALVVGAAYLIHRETSRASSQPEPSVQPVHRHGF